VKKFASTVILLVFVFSSLSNTQPRLEKAFASKVSEGRLRQTVRDLVKLGNRLGGTKSGDMSASYVMKKMKSYGLKTTLVDDPVRLVYENLGWTLDVVEPRGLRGLFKNAWLAGFSPSVTPRTARLVFIGQPDGVKAEAVESAAVLVPYIVSSEHYRELVEAGAVCILSYFPNEFGSYTNWALINDLPASKDNSIPLFNISLNNGERLRKQLQADKKVVLKFSAKTTIGTGQPKTVIATLLGASPEHFLVCAHGDSDSGGPGADDNGSGVAGVIELARVMNSLVVSKALPKPKKSIKFVVWGSEYFSAESYVKRNVIDLENIAGVLNYDEIGTGKTRDCLYFEGNDIPQNHHLMNILQKVGEDYVGKKGFWRESTTNPSQGGTDSYVFLQNYLDKLSLPDTRIPSVTIYTAAWNVPKALLQTDGWLSTAWKGHPDSVNIDYSPYYHSSLDVPETTTEKEPYNMTWAVKAVGIALLRLAW